MKIAQLLSAVGDALWLSFTMFWQIFWGLSLGFALFAIKEIVICLLIASALWAWVPDSFWQGSRAWTVVIWSALIGQLIAIALIILLLRTGWPKMMRMMSGKGQHEQINHHSA